ncbi:hypothetical protein OA314_00860 [bacterium]|nr:hypothetical protein [bacterium]
MILIFTLPMLGTNSLPIARNAAAADACSGNIEPILWNQTVGRSALVPHHNYYSGYFGFGDYYDDDRKGRDHENDWIYEDIRLPTELNPEEDWMYEDWDRDTRLQPLTANYHSTMLVGNDSIGALRVNLSEDYRTTICITVQALNETDDDYSIDVYLMTTSEYQRYTELYYSSHSQNSFYDEISEALSDISPEWRGIDFTGWRSYRDAHQYESVNQINFALNLDGPESYKPIFGDERWQDFYIIIDTWDNNHDNDAVAPGVVTAADVTIITTERTFVLPNFTVAIIFLMMMIGMIVLPFILNARYMKSGLEIPVGDTEPGLVPSLEVAPEIAMQSNNKISSDKNFPEIKDLNLD